MSDQRIRRVSIERIREDDRLENSVDDRLENKEDDNKTTGCKKILKRNIPLPGEGISAP